MRALHGRQTERLFQLTSGALVGFVVVAVGGGRHAVGVDARPDDVPVAPPFLLVLDDEARVPVKTEIALQGIDRPLPLLRRQVFVGAGIEVGVIEEILAPGAAGQRVHFAQGFKHGVTGQPTDFCDLDPLVFFALHQVLGEKSPVAATASVDDHRGPLPRVVKIAAMTSR